MQLKWIIHAGRVLQVKCIWIATPGALAIYFMNFDHRLSRAMSLLMKRLKSGIDDHQNVRMLFPLLSRSFYIQVIQLMLNYKTQKKIKRMLYINYKEYCCRSGSQYV